MYSIIIHLSKDTCKTDTYNVVNEIYPTSFCEKKKIEYEVIKLNT